MRVLGGKFDPGLFRPFIFDPKAGPPVAHKCDLDREGLLAVGLLLLGVALPNLS